jgi:hypothetical protein
MRVFFTGQFEFFFQKNKIEGTPIIKLTMVKRFSFCVYPD